MKKIKFQKFLPKNKFKKNIFKKKQFDSLIKDIEKNLSLKKNVFHSFSKNFHLNINLNELRKFKIKYKRIIIIGMGGSILSSEAIYCFFKEKIKKKLIFIDNLDEVKIKNLKKEKNLKNSLFILISKSGNTIETLAVIESLNQAKLNEKNTVIITENKKSELSSYARKKNIKMIYHRNYIGGRYSVLSETGIIPAYLMGLNINRLRKNILYYLNKDPDELKNNLIHMLKIY